MTDATYTYASASAVEQRANALGLTLAHHTELEEVNAVPCFFWGRVVEPYLTAKCLTTVAKTVRSRFALTAQDFAAMRDPIVTAGNEQVRFEGFSSCNGVYARLDILPKGLDGEFLASGTTNVDFNEPMINALNNVKNNENMLLSMGQKEVSISTDNAKVTEKKVTLPQRWIKGLTSVQHYLAEMDLVFEINQLQALQLFQTLPKGTLKNDLFVVQRAAKTMFSPLQSGKSVRVGSAHRLRLMESLLPHVQKVQIYQSEDTEACAWVLTLGQLRLVMAFSAHAYRGFSGEGKALQFLLEEVPMEWVYGLNNTLRANEYFDPTLLAIENDIAFSSADALTANLSSMGMLGYDLVQRQHFFRRLPFKLERILSLNPRLKNAKKLVAANDIQVTDRREGYIQARVKGTGGVFHTVILEGDASRCTCEWFTDHQGKRGLCKHVLAVKMSI
ncbi:MAG: hypothetical protein MUE30_02850 [Spirosomaceae bacterium]|jgi:hypothetical protein|nr:hypothetical protein [Spirosomataceae bacterium]